MLVSSFNLAQLFNYAPYPSFANNGSNQRSIVSVNGPWFCYAQFFCCISDARHMKVRAPIMADSF